jgi:hypothetical protein
MSQVIELDWLEPSGVWGSQFLRISVTDWYWEPTTISVELKRGHYAVFWTQAEQKASTKTANNKIIYLPVRPSVCLSVCLPSRLSVRPSIQTVLDEWLLFIYYAFSTSLVIEHQMIRYLRMMNFPVWWPGNNNSPTVNHACRKRRLKWVPGSCGV